MAAWLYFAVPATAVFIAYSVHLNRTNKRTLESQRAQFRNRPPLDPESWFAREFGGLGVSKERVEAILQPVATTMGCSVTQLLSSDSFEGNLRWRGRTFLGIDDDNPWDDFVEQSLPSLCGSEEKLSSVIAGLQEN